MTDNTCKHVNDDDESASHFRNYLKSTTLILINAQFHQTFITLSAKESATCAMATMWVTLSCWAEFEET